MTRALPWLLPALLLAGCGGGDEPEDATYGPRPLPEGMPHPRIGPGPGDLHEAWVANGTFALGATQARQQAMATLPNGTQQVVFTLHFESGAIAAFHADLDGCPLEVTGPAPATGQALSKDCGRMEGIRTLTLEQSVGMLTGQYGVQARYWLPASG